jgi:Ca-activated chloride channel family protein
VPPDPRTLEQISELTGGQSFTAPTEQDLKSIYEHLASKIGFNEERQEITAAFAAAALALMAVGGGLSVWWFNRFP